MIKILGIVALLASTALAMPEPRESMSVEVTVERAVKTSDGKDVDANAKQSLQTQFWDAKLLERIVQCSKYKRAVLFAVVQVGKTKSRAISTGLSPSIRGCVEAALATVKGAELTATVTVLFDPLAAQHVPRGGVVPDKPAKKKEDEKPNPF